jgi:hypothetical protein
MTTLRVGDLITLPAAPGEVLVITEEYIHEPTYLSGCGLLAGPRSSKPVKMGSIPSGRSND